MLKGYIYIRNHPSYTEYDVCKLGKTNNIPERDSHYATGEFIRGYFYPVFEIFNMDIESVEKMLHKHFESLNIRRDGGIEFYKKDIIYSIESYFNHIGIKYKSLTKDEIDNLVRKKRELSLRPKLPDIIPHNHQQYILDIIINFYVNNNIGKIIWACGLGKALLSIMIVLLLRFKTVVIGVPSKNLQIQMRYEILKIFPHRRNILMVGSGINSTSNKTKIKNFLKSSANDCLFVITTYHSCHLLVDEDIKFDFKIGDEAHHLVSLSDSDRSFNLFHEINASKTLFMTATEKVIETISSAKYSMDNTDVFGEYIDIKSVHWAIENKKITDYNVLLIKNTEAEVDEIIDTLGINVSNKDLFLSSYMCLKSFEKVNGLSHLLLYTNTIDEAILAEEYIDKIISLDILSITQDSIYNKALYSGNCDKLQNEIDKFKNSTYGIIPCVYIFGEGFDLPKLNGVCVGSNMRSEIRIVQYLLRPNRLDRDNPNKIAHIIIPYIDSRNWGNNDNSSYNKVKNIIYQLRNVDETIEQKIKMLTSNRKSTVCPTPHILAKDDFQLEENETELVKIRLRLRYSKTLNSNLSEEQDEYNNVKGINKSLNIKSKKEYFQSSRNHEYFISDPENYFKKNCVWGGWYDFMGFDTSVLIPTKDEWHKFCREKKIKSLKEYFDNCEKYIQLPSEPGDFYLNFSTIVNELGFNQRRR